jgi:DNA-binding LacI/PurR family transcriptional regulator
MAAAAQLNYMTNPVARSLARGRTGNLGLIVPNIASPFYGVLMQAVQRRARVSDSSVFMADADEHSADEGHIAYAMAKQVDGLLIASPRLSAVQLEDLSREVPLVVINPPPDCQLPSVIVNGVDGVKQAVEHLAAAGHRRIIYLAGPPDSVVNAQRAEQFRLSCAELDVTAVELGPLRAGRESGVRVTDQVIADGATAVIAFNDFIALGVLTQLNVRGIKAGTEISVVGIDDTWFAELFQPALTSIRIPTAQAGSTAISLILDVIDGREDTPTVKNLPSELIVRASSGPPVSTKAVR